MGKDLLPVLSLPTGILLLSLAVLLPFFLLVAFHIVSQRTECLEEATS